VFGDDECVWREHGGGACATEEVQRRCVFAVGFPGRIEVDDIELTSGPGEVIEEGGDSAGLDGVAGGDAERVQVGTEGSESRGGLFGEPDVCRATTEGLDANRTRTRVEIDKAGSGQARGEDVEEGFAQTIAGGPGAVPAGRNQASRAVGSGDDAHSFIMACGCACDFRRGNLSCAYNTGMRGWSFLAGRLFGVEVRIHAFFLLLLALGMTWAAVGGLNPMRMLVLWGLLLLAVLIRETARALAAAWFGLELRGILLLPTGGLMSFTTLEATEIATQAKIQRRMALVGPAASVGAGLLLAGLILSSAPGVNLMGRPWVSPAHLLRSLVWINVLLGLINLLPALPLDGGHMLEMSDASGKQGAQETPAGASKALARLWGFGGGFSRWAAIGLIVSGILLSNMWYGVWLGLIGAFMLIGARMEGQGMLIQSEVDTVRMRDVMLTQFSTLSASDTLEDALQRAVHTLQDVFPVVRGDTLVGSVSRQNILEALAAEGNSYVQGVMTRSFQTAQPDDSLVKTLRRILGDQGAQLVPVMDGERIVGIVTPQNLSQSMGLLNQSRRFRRAEN